MGHDVVDVGKFAEGRIENHHDYWFDQYLSREGGGDQCLQRCSCIVPVLGDLSQRRLRGRKSGGTLAQLG